MKNIFLFFLISLFAFTAVFAAESAYGPGVKPDTVQVTEVSYYADTLLFTETSLNEATLNEATLNDATLFSPEIKVAYFDLSGIKLISFVPETQKEAFTLRGA
jgi:hypothetical protein